MKRSCLLNPTAAVGSPVRMLLHCLVPPFHTTIVFSDYRLLLDELNCNLNGSAKYTTI